MDGRAFSKDAAGAHRSLKVICFLYVGLGNPV